MEGSANSARETRIETERKLLGALCQSRVNYDTRITILGRLRDHVFAEPDHEIVYRALAAMPTVDPSDTLQALTQAVTRMGFPDLDLGGLFFEEYSPTSDEIASLVGRL
jgi:hypothetical protein